MTGKRAIPADSVPFHAVGHCPTCGHEIIVDGLWPTSWGPRPDLVVTHYADGRHAPEFTDVEPVSPGLFRKRPKGN